MNILGLDPATECGWALYTDGTIISGVWDLMRKNTLACGDHPILYLVDDIRRVHEVNPLNLICFEAPISYGNSGRGASGMLAAATKCGAIVTEAGRIGCHFSSVAPAALKSFARRHCRDEFPEKGLGDKDCMFNAAKAFFHKVPADDNEADALWVMQWGFEQYETILQSCEKSCGEKGSSSVTEPTRA